MFQKKNVGCLIILLCIGGCVSQAPVEVRRGEISVQPGSSLSEKYLTADTLVRIRDIDSLSVSPDGQRIAFQLRQALPESKRYANEWYVVEVSGESLPVFQGYAGTPQIVRPVNSPPSGYVSQAPAKWSNDGAKFAYSLVKCDDAPSLVDCETVEVAWSELTDGAQSSFRFDVNALPGYRWSPDGELLFFLKRNEEPDVQSLQLSHEPDGGYLYDNRFMPSLSSLPVFTAVFDAASAFQEKAELNELEELLWRYNLNDDTLQKASNAEISQYVAFASENDAAIIGEELGLPANIQSIYETGRALLATPLRFGASQESLAWVDLVDPKDPALWPDVTLRVDLDGDGRDPFICHASECSGRLTDIWVTNETGSAVIFRRAKANTNDPRTAIFRWEIGNDVVTPILLSDAELDECQYAEPDLICLFEDLQQPNKIVAVNLNDGSIRDIFDPNPEYGSINLGSVERLDLSYEGETIAYAHLVLPPEFDPEVRYPLIVTTSNSRGFLRGATGDEFPIYPWAASGFAVLSFNAAYIGGFSPIPNFSNEKRYRLEEWQDYKINVALIDQAIDQLDERGLIDPSRMAITGLSRGSGIAHHALMYSQHNFVAASTPGAAWSPIMYYLGGNFYRSFFLEPFGLGLPDGESSDFWSYISSDLNVYLIDAAVLIQAADREFLLSTQFIETMKAREKPVEAYVFEDEYHIKYWPQHRLAVYERNIDWMRFWLQGIEDSHSEKAAQYDRWRTMRAGACAVGRDRGLSYCEYIEH